MSAWGSRWGNRWGNTWGAVEAAIAAAQAQTGGGLPEGGSRKEPRHINDARRASEERRLRRLQALDDAIQAAWDKLHPSDQIVVSEIPLPEEIRADVRIADLVMRPRIDFERAIEESARYRQAIASLENMLAIYEARLEAEESDIEVLLLAAM